jgi:hypothetical protein
LSNFQLGDFIFPALAPSFWECRLMLNYFIAEMLLEKLTQSLLPALIPVMKYLLLQ